MHVTKLEPVRTRDDRGRVPTPLSVLDAVDGVADPPLAVFARLLAFFFLPLRRAAAGGDEAISLGIFAAFAASSELSVEGLGGKSLLYRRKLVTLRGLLADLVPKSPEAGRW